MSKIEYNVFLEAAGDRPLTPDKIQVGFWHLDGGEITHSESFSISELGVHIEHLDPEDTDIAIYREALGIAKEACF